jgi:4-hydroxythreonine-4-phosphate dehydrogenase
VGVRATVHAIAQPEEAEPTPRTIPCLEATEQDVASVPPGRVDPRAGRAAYDYLTAAVDLALQGRIDAITTLPLHKEALHAAGVRHPGHTEILAERCGTPDHAMMLYLAPEAESRGSGLGVVHVTLHVALRRVFELLTEEAVESKIHLADTSLRPLLDGRQPRVAVAALNPHAGEGGLFGDEERRIIEPAVARARKAGIDVAGPIACDTLFARALAGEFDAVVAMYHDQGHIALKTTGFHRAVNVTLGLPIVRTSVAHGTAFDVAWQGIAETQSLIAAVSVAARLVAGRRGIEFPTKA